MNRIMILLYLTEFLPISKPSNLLKPASPLVEYSYMVIVIHRCLQLVLVLNGAKEKELKKSYGTTSNENLFCFFACITIPNKNLDVGRRCHRSGFETTHLYQYSNANASPSSF